MKAGRNDPRPCGSGRKYKRCCIDRDEVLERDRRAAAEPADADEMVAAFTSSLRAVTVKDPTALGDLLHRFADVLRTGDTLADARFDDDAFARAVERSLSRLGRAGGPKARARLFQHAMGELGDPRSMRRLHDQLARALSAATLSTSDREAVAAALVCLAPALGGRAVPASESPTLEIVFNVQLEAWMERLGARAPELKVALRDVF